MSKKRSKKDRLPYHIVKDSHNQIRLKIRETLSGVTKRYSKIPKKILSSGIIILGIMVITLMALFIRGKPYTQDNITDQLPESSKAGIVDVVIDENNQLQVLIPQVMDISLEGGELQLTPSTHQPKTDELKDQPVQTTVKVINTPQSAEGTQSEVKKLEIIYPLRRQVGVITEYGWAFQPILEKWRYHQGVDLRCKKGDLVMAAAAGKVVDIKENFYEILLVTIEHGNGWTTHYGQLGQLTVKIGDTVAKGQQIGNIGQSETAIEPHLHFEIRYEGKTEDPQTFLIGN